MIRTKGEAGTGNIVEVSFGTEDAALNFHIVPPSQAVRHARAVQAEIRRASTMTDEELYTYAKEIQAPYHLLKETARLKKLPVVTFAAGGIATPGKFISPWEQTVF